jgi:hypothetical protein
LKDGARVRVWVRIRVRARASARVQVTSENQKRKRAHAETLNEEMKLHVFRGASELLRLFVCNGNNKIRQDMAR